MTSRRLLPLAALAPLAIALTSAFITGAALAQDKKPADPWVVPTVDKLADDKYGKLVRQGKELVERTYAHIGPEVKDPARRYAGNNLSCSTCHMDAGGKQFGNPFVGTFADYPQYRPREDTVQTIEERVNGCMERSMAGKALPLDSLEMKAFVAYLKHMSTGVPVSKVVAGRGVPKIAFPDRAADPARGKEVYATFCQACHGANGEGQRIGKAGDAQGYSFPPLWGADSYSNGAGMARVITAAGFIKGNMPKGVQHDAPALTDEQALDVAAFINSQPRPQKAGLENDFPNRKIKPVDAAFPPYRAGFTAEQHKYGPFKPIIQAREAEMKGELRAAQ